MGCGWIHREVELLVLEFLPTDCELLGPFVCRQATNIPPFFVGFVLTPLASNASELVSSLKFAARKRRKNISLTISQVCLFAPPPPFTRRSDTEALTWLF
jgi:hypothetical protein